MTREGSETPRKEGLAAEMPVLIDFDAPAER